MAIELSEAKWNVALAELKSDRMDAQPLLRQFVKGGAHASPALFDRTACPNGRRCPA
jgi:hypothetical protein